MRVERRKDCGSGGVPRPRTYAGRGLASDKRIWIYGILEQVEQHLEEPFMISGAM